MDDNLADQSKQQPIRINSADDIDWAVEADVLIVGFGGAGAAAAIEARMAGADVVVIDRFRGGGTTALSGGIVYAGATSYQREAGFDDTPDEMFKYLSLELGGVVSKETLRRFCEGSEADIEWLVENGVGFSGTFHPGKTSYPPPKKYLYFSGNEAISGYREHAKPAPRGHRTFGKGWTGYRFFDALKTSALKKGVHFRSHCIAKRLVIDNRNVVVGVEVVEFPDDEKLRKAHSDLYDKVSPIKPFNAEAAEAAIVAADALETTNATRKFIRARGGVILATGGFAYNLDLLKRHAPLYAENYSALLRMGTMGCDGSGMALGVSAGGECGYMDSLFVARNISPPNALLRGVLVNEAGKRFINEENYAGFVGKSIGEQIGGRAWLILDSSTFRKAVWEAITAGPNAFRYFSIPVLLNMFFGGTRRGSSIQELAKRCGIDPDVLQITLANYNDKTASRDPDDEGKSDGNRVVLTGKYLAINMSISNRFGFTMLLTLGGLRVDELTGHVVDHQGRSIPGLYAAGRAAVGLCSHGYFSGMSLADGVFSGRRAGLSSANVARNEKSTLTYPKAALRNSKDI